MVSRVYDRVADQYDEDWSGLYAAARAKCVSQIAARMHESDRPLDVADLGIGTGNALQDLQRRIPLGDCTGLDVSQGMLTQASRKLANGVRLIHDDAARAGAHLAPQSQDLVLCHFLLSFVDADRLVDVAHDLLRPGGIVSLATSTQESLSELHRIHYPRASRLVGIQRSLHKSGTPRDLAESRALLESHGFEIVDEHLLRQPVSFESFDDVRSWALDSGWAASFLDDPLGFRKLFGRAAFAVAEMLIHPFYPIPATNEISILLGRKTGASDRH